MTELHVGAEMKRLLEPHMALMSDDLQADWPQYDPELCLLQWLCERNHVKPPASRRTEARDALVLGSLLPSATRSSSSRPHLPQLSARSAEREDLRTGGMTPRTPRRNVTTPVSVLSPRNISRKSGLIGALKMQVGIDADICAAHLEQLHGGVTQVRTVISGMRQDVRGKFINRVPLLSSDVLSQEEQFNVVGRLRPLLFTAGDTIVREGEIGDTLYIIEQGTCDVSKFVDGCDQHLTSIRRQDFFGELAMIHARPRAATVTAKTDVTLLCLARDDLFSSIGKEKQHRVTNIARSRLFSSIPALAGLTPRQQLKVTEQLSIKTWAPGSQLVAQNEHVEGSTRRMYIIEDGQCRAVKQRARSAQGSTNFAETLLTGAYFDLLSMMYGSPRERTIVAETAVRTLSLAYDDLLSLSKMESNGADPSGEDMMEGMKKSMRLHLLSQADDLDVFDDEQIQTMLEFSEIVSYKKWEVVHSKGSRLKHIYVLEDGALVEYDGDLADMKGDPYDLVEHRTPGKLFGGQLMQDRRAVAETTLAAVVDSRAMRVPAFVLHAIQSKRTGRSRSSLLRFSSTAFFSNFKD